MLNTILFLLLYNSPLLFIFYFLNILLYFLVFFLYFKGFILVGNKSKWLLFKTSCLYARQVAVTCRRGTSVVRNLKFLTPFFNF